MKVIQKNERAFMVILSDAELDDLTQEAEIREFTPLEIMKAVFVNSFIQIVSCFWRRSMLRGIYKGAKMNPENVQDKPEPDGG